jgi:hypothetical protein
MSSLHIGHISLELAEAAAVGPCSSSATRDARSSVSEEIGVVDVCELRDIELSEGDNRLVFRVC